MEVIQEVEMSSEGFSEEEMKGGSDIGDPESKKPDIDRFRPASLEILDHVKINVEPKSPVSTLKGVLKNSSRSDLSFSRQELKKAEELMTKAFSEFYQKLRLLKSYW